jgi:hypothetical protein
MIVWHDAANDQLGLCLDGAASPILVSWSGGVFAHPTAEFQISLQSNRWNGMVDEVGFWKRVLTPAERAEIYNSGAGKTYPFT